MVEDGQIQLVRPPIFIGPRTSLSLGLRCGYRGVFALTDAACMFLVRHLNSSPLASLIDSAFNELLGARQGDKTTSWIHIVCTPLRSHMEDGFSDPSTD